MNEIKRSYYGLAERPKFEQALDAALTSLRIPLPDRAAKRQANSLYRAKMLENEKIAAGMELNGMEYRLSNATVPEAVIHVQPSPSADDALFEAIAQHHQTHFENEQERRMRHQVDEQTRQNYMGERHGDLMRIHSQGRTSHILHGEASLDERMSVELEEGLVPGHVYEKKAVNRAAPPNLPPASGDVAFPEFPTYRELNQGQVRMEGVMGQQLPKTGESYESLRDSAALPKYQ
jgi:hypothetical protein